MRISDWSSDVCSSDLPSHPPAQDRDQPGRRRPLAKFERQPSERVLDLGERLRVMKTELGLAMDRAAEADEVAQEGFGLGGPASRDLVHFFPPNSCRPARSSMISSLPPPIALTRTSR